MSAHRIHSRLWAVAGGILLLAAPVASQDPSTWQAAIAKVTVQGLAPATAFVYAISNGVAYLVTSAHVIGQENSPAVEFQSAPGRPYPAAIHDLQSDDRNHGLVWLSVQNPPPSVRAIPAYSGTKPAGGDDVRFVGYPQPTGRFSQVNATIMRREGSDLVLSYETGPGFSGGPVLRNGQVVGMIWGGGAGEGKALIADDLRIYLDGADVSWDGSAANAPPPITGFSGAIPARAKNPPANGTKINDAGAALLKDGFGFTPPLAAGATKRNPVDGLTYVWIPPGNFMMGCSKDAAGKYDSECYGDENAESPVDIPAGFWIGQTEVPLGAYQKWPEAPKHPLPTADSAGRKINTDGNPDLPVVTVTWQEAQDYCKWAGGLRLPREKEWEYAARAGSTAPRYGPLDSIAWYGDNSGGAKINSTQWWNENGSTYNDRLFKNGDGSHPGQQKQKNAWNLFDTLGNVWEWVEDWYDAYPGGVIPAGAGARKNRVLRGGSWSDFPQNVRVSGRLAREPESRGSSYGIRCAGELR